MLKWKVVSEKSWVSSKKDVIESNFEFKTPFVLYIASRTIGLITSHFPYGTYSTLEEAKQAANNYRNIGENTKYPFHLC